MKPYYDDGKGIVIYHADCREVLPTLGRVDLVLTDPPYGIDIVRSDGKMGGTSKDIKRWAGQINPVYAPVHGDDKPIDPAMVLDAGRKHILWGGNYIADKLPPSPTWLIWYKRINGIQNDFSDCELAWSDIGGPARVFQHMWMGMLRDSEQGIHLHPTQKPVALMSWCLACVPGIAIVIDPYMGSGPVLEAAKNVGLTAIGIEIEERYCEIAARRLSQQVLAFPPPEPKPPTPAAPGLFEDGRAA